MSESCSIKKIIRLSKKKAKKLINHFFSENGFIIVPSTKIAIEF